MTCLPDTNVWLALSVGEHVQHRAAKQWLESAERDQIVFCRVTQMVFSGYCRILT